jgi:hypothetical protein
LTTKENSSPLIKSLRRRIPSARKKGNGERDNIVIDALLPIGVVKATGNTKLESDSKHEVNANNQ